MRDINPNQLRVAFTGGPYAGKSTTLLELQALDSDGSFAFVPEASTLVINEERNLKSPILPHTDLIGFQNLVSKRQLSIEDFVLSAKHKAPIAYFDRTGVDNYAYCTLGGFAPSDDVLEAVGHRRFDLVFSFDLLPSYKPDEIRSESSKLRAETHGQLLDTYKSFGYDVISVPVMPAKERAQFILYKTLNQLTKINHESKSEVPQLVQYTDFASRKVRLGKFSYVIPSSSPGNKSYDESHRYDLTSGGSVSLAYVKSMHKAQNLYHIMRKEKYSKYTLDSFLNLGSQFDLPVYETKEIMWNWARSGILELSLDRKNVSYVPENKRDKKLVAV